MSAYTDFLVFSGGAITQAKSGDTVSMAASLTLTSTAGLVINSGVAANLTIAETGLTRSNADIALNTGAAHKVTTDGSLAVTGSMTVGGNLTVAGDVISADSKNVLIGDSFIDLNAENGTTSAKAGGFTVQVRVGTNFNTGSGGAPIEVNQFYATGGGTGGAYPYFTVDSGDQAFFNAGDVIAIKGALNAGVDNNGLFVVESVATGQVAVKNAAITQLPFIQTAFTAYTPAGSEAFAYGVNLAAFAISNGSLNSSGGSIAPGHPCYVYAADATQTSIEGYWVDLVGGTVTLQNAYDGGSTITLTNGSNLTVNVPVSSGTAGILLNAKGVNSNFTVDDANLEIKTTTSGTLTLTGYGDTTVDSTGNGEVRIGTGNYTGEVKIGTAGARTITVGSSSATKIQLNARTVFDTTTGALGIGYDGVTFGTVSNNDVVCRASSGSYEKSDQTALTTSAAIEVVGVAVDTSNGILHTILGGIVGITFATPPGGTSDISKAVYLSSTTGQATMSAPSSGRVVRLGNLHSSTALSGSIYPVVWNPQVIADL